MKILAIDLSTKSGVAWFDTEKEDMLLNAFDIEFTQPTPMTQFTVVKKAIEDMKKKPKRKRTINKYDSSNHPQDFIDYVSDYFDFFNAELESRDIWPNIMLLEQTNKGRDRWKQKLLEWLHYEICLRCYKNGIKVAYIDTVEWRNILELKMTRGERKLNKTIRKHNIASKEGSGLKRVSGIISSKVLAVERANELFNLDMKRKHHNIADAICLGYAYIQKHGLRKGDYH